MSDSDDSVVAESTSSDTEYLSDSSGDDVTSEDLDCSAAGEKKVSQRRLLTMLYSAAMAGNNTEVTRVIKAGVKVDQKLLGESALSLVAQRGFASVVATLVEAGAHLDVRNYDGQRPLTLAARGGHAECVRLLVDAGATVDVEASVSGTALYMAAEKGHHACVEILIEAGSDVNYVQPIEQRSVLIAAARHGSVKCCELLLRADADVNHVDGSGNNALYYSVVRVSPKCCEILIEAKVNVSNVNNAGYSALMLAAKWGDSKCVRLLVDSGAELDTTDVDGLTERHLAEESSWLKEGKTALFLAAESNNLKCVECLLRAGADMYMHSKSGARMLSAVAYKNLDECVETLIDHGVDVNIADVSGNTALMSAASAAHMTVMLRLLRAGADINARDEGGATVVFAAMKSDSVNCLKFLLLSGAKINQKNNKGQNALQYYVEASYSLLKQKLKALAKLLYVAGEKIDGTTVNKYFFVDLDDGSEDDSDIEEENGEDVKIVNYLKLRTKTKKSGTKNVTLLELSRDAVRTHLVAVDNSTHLFTRVKQLEIPCVLHEHLLYGMTLDYE